MKNNNFQPELKIPVKKEGREGIYLVEKDEIIDFIVKRVKGRIHCFIGDSPMMIGADWDKTEVKKFIRKEAKQIAIMTEPNFTMKHQLVCLTDNKRYSFDIGEIELKDLEVKQ